MARHHQSSKDINRDLMKSEKWKDASGVIHEPKGYVLLEPPADIAKACITPITEDRVVKLDPTYEKRAAFKLWKDAHAVMWWKAYPIRSGSDIPVYVMWVIARKGDVKVEGLSE